MGLDDYKNKTRGKMTLDAHRLEEENKRIEESEALGREIKYAKKRGLPWPPEEHEKEWEADRQHWVDEARKALKKVFKPMPDKPALKKPPPLDREAARAAAKRIVATDAFKQYEKKHDDDLPF